MEKQNEPGNLIRRNEVKRVDIIARMVREDGMITENTIFTIQDMDLNMQKEGEESSLIFTDLEIHLKEQGVYYRKEPVTLSRYEFYTLCYLAQHPNWVFSKEQIYEAVWNESGEHCGTAVTNIISQLRRKLNQEDPDIGYIRTVIGRGYKFVG